MPGSNLVPKKIYSAKFKVGFIFFVTIISIDMSDEHDDSQFGSSGE